MKLVFENFNLKKFFSFRSLVCHPPYLFRPFSGERAVWKGRKGAVLSQLAIGRPQLSPPQPSISVKQEPHSSRCPPASPLHHPCWESSVMQAYLATSVLPMQQACRWVWYHHEIDLLMDQVSVCEGGGQNDPPRAQFSFLLPWIRGGKKETAEWRE